VVVTTNSSAPLWNDTYIGEKYSLEEMEGGRLRVTFTSKPTLTSTLRNLKAIDMLTSIDQQSGLITVKAVSN
jgi:hypothetical protein